MGLLYESVMIGSNIATLSMLTVASVRLNRLMNKDRDDDQHFIEKTITTLDLNKHVVEFANNLKSYPYLFVLEDCRFTDTSTGNTIWAANGITSRRFYSGVLEDLKLTILDKKVLNQCIIEYKRWNRRTDKYDTLEFDLNF